MAIESLVNEHERAISEYQERVGSLHIDLDKAKQESQDIKNQMKTLQSELTIRESELEEEKQRVAQLNVDIEKTQVELYSTQEGTKFRRNFT